MINDENIAPSFNEVIRSARTFIRAINNHYGQNIGAKTWNTIINNLEECVVNDIIFGLIADRSEIVLAFVPDDCEMVPAVMALRSLTGKSIREAKNGIEQVKIDKKPLVIDISDRKQENVDQFITRMRELGCLIN